MTKLSTAQWNSGASQKQAGLLSLMNASHSEGIGTCLPTEYLQAKAAGGHHCSCFALIIFNPFSQPPALSVRFTARTFVALHSTALRKVLFGVVCIILVLCLLILSAACDVHDDKGASASPMDAFCSFATSQYPLTHTHAESLLDSTPIIRPNLVAANMSDSGKPEEKPTAELDHEHEHEHEPETEMNANEEVREARKEVD